MCCRDHSCPGSSSHRTGAERKALFRNPPPFTRARYEHASAGSQLQCTRSSIGVTSSGRAGRVCQLPPQNDGVSRAVVAVRRGCAPRRSVPRRWPGVLHHEPPHSMGHRQRRRPAAQAAGRRGTSVRGTCKHRCLEAARSLRCGPRFASRSAERKHLATQAAFGRPTADVDARPLCVAHQRAAARNPVRADLA